MNYQRVREEAKKKIQARKLELSRMPGHERTILEQHLVKEAENEEVQRLKKEAEELKLQNEKLKADIEKSDKDALEILQKNEDLELQLQGKSVLEKEKEDLEAKNLDLENKVKELSTPKVEVQINPVISPEEVKKALDNKPQHHKNAHTNSHKRR